MMLVTWRRAVDIIAMRARRIACIVIDRRPGLLRIWRIVSSGMLCFFFLLIMKGRVVKEKFNNSSRSVRDLASLGMELGI